MSDDGKHQNQRTFGERLKIAISNAGLTQQALAKAVGVSPPTVFQYLRGDFIPKANRLTIIAKALNVNELWLQGYDVSMDAPLLKVKTLRDSLKLSQTTGIPIMSDEEVPDMEIANEKQEIIEKIYEFFQEESDQQIYDLNSRIKSYFTLDSYDWDILVLYNNLKPRGKSKLLEYAQDLNRISDYLVEEESEQNSN